MPRTRYITYFQSNDLTDRHAAEVLADKALERVTARNSALRESRRNCRLGSDDSQDQNRHGHETEEKDEKADTFNNEMVRYRFCQCWARSDS